MTAAAIESVVHEVDGLVVDIRRYRVTVDGEDIRLSPVLFDLLAKLASDPDRVFRHAELLREVWGFESTIGISDRCVKEAARRTHIALGRRFVFAARGVGYRLRD